MGLETKTIVVLFDNEGLISEIADEFIRIAEMPRDLLLGQEFSSILSATTEQGEDFGEIIKAVELWSGVVIIQSGSSEKIYLEVDLVPINGSSLQVFNAEVVVRDFMSLELDEIADKTDLRMLREASRLAKIGVWELDLETMLPSWSEEVFTIHELENNYQPSHEESMSYYPPEARKELQATIDRAISSGEPWSIELPFVTAKKNNIWVRAMGEVEFEFGKPTKLIGLFQDINDRKQAEEQIQQYLKELTLAKKVAEGAAKTKAEFLANMSHEIRTPMNGILGMCELFYDTPLSVEQQDYLDTVSTSARALLAIINDILDFSKIEAGKLELELHSMNLREDLEGVINLLYSGTEPKGLGMYLNYSHRLPDCFVADSGRIRQIVLNLCTT